MMDREELRLECLRMALSSLGLPPAETLKHAQAYFDFDARARARMKALNADRLSWCPPELIDDYRLLVRHLGAQEARVLIESQMRKAA